MFGGGGPFVGPLTAPFMVRYGVEDQTVCYCCEGGNAKDAVKVLIWMESGGFATAAW